MKLRKFTIYVCLKIVCTVSVTILNRLESQKRAVSTNSRNDILAVSIYNSRKKAVETKSAKLYFRGSNFRVKGS